MTRYALKTAFAWLCLLVQLIASTSSAAGLVLCVDGDGSVAIETRLTQLTCCGGLANPDKRPYGESELFGEDACVDVSLTLPASLRAASSRATDDVYSIASAVTTIAVPLLFTTPTHRQLRLLPQILLPDRTREAISTIVLLV